MRRMAIWPAHGDRTYGEWHSNELKMEATHNMSLRCKRQLDLSSIDHSVAT